VISFKHRPLHFRRKSPRYILGRRLGEPQSRSRRGGEENNFLPCPWRETNPGRSAGNLVTILTELPRLTMKSNEMKELHKAVLQDPYVPAPNICSDLSL